MNRKIKPFHASRDAFLRSLHDYQKATLRMNLALQKLAQHTQDLYKPLKHIAHTTTSMVAPDRLDG